MVWSEDQIVGGGFKITTRTVPFEKNVTNKNNLISSIFVASFSNLRSGKNVFLTGKSIDFARGVRKRETRSHELSKQAGRSFPMGKKTATFFGGKRLGGIGSPAMAVVTPPLWLPMLCGV